MLNELNCLLKSTGPFFPTSPYLRGCSPISDFLYLWKLFQTLKKLILSIMLKRFIIFNQIFDWLPYILIGIVSFLFDKILFSSSLSSFVDNSFHLVNLVEYYFDLFLLNFG